MFTKIIIYLLITLITSLTVFYLLRTAKLKIFYLKTITWLKLMRLKSPLYQLANSSKTKSYLISSINKLGLKKWNINHCLILKEIILWLLVIVVLWNYGNYLSSNFLLLLLFLLLLFFYPEIILRSRIKNRKQLANQDLPYLIDFLILFLNTGINIELAIRHAQSIKSIWKSELELIVSQFDHGIQLDQALLASSERIDLPGYSRIISSLRQSRELGIPIVKTLNIHAKILRAENKSQVQELAHAASAKMSLPLVLCIFPALLIIYLAPAVLQFLKTI
ncbi:type II secretion system F family protein [Candidatus Azambacteria bacterium]|nr:type II secretion system F family protein [Candidatus Azambacteria bacterium]